MNHKTVVLLTPYWENTIGGITTFVMNLVKELKKRNNLRVIVGTNDKVFEKNDVIGIKRNKYLSIIDIVYKLKMIRPSVIHCHNLETLLIGSIIYKLAINRKTKVFFTFHTEPSGKKKENGFKTRIFLSAVKKCRALTFVSRSIAVGFLEKCGRRTIHYKIIMPGVKKKKKGCNDLDNIKKKYSELIGSPVLCAISVLEWEKKVQGIQMLIHAVRLLKKEYPNITLLIAGDGTLRDLIQREIEESSLEKNVILCGYIKNPYAILELSQIYCHISLQEGLPQAILEAMEAERPVIATNIGGIPEVVIHKNTGYLVEPTVESVHAGLSEMLKNPSSLVEMTQRSKQMVSTQLTWEKVADQFIDLYES